MYKQLEGRALWAPFYGSSEKMETRKNQYRNHVSLPSSFVEQLHEKRLPVQKFSLSHIPAVVL